PHDHPGKEIIRQIAQLSRDEQFQHRIVFIDDYDMEVARQLLHGGDVWLNTPRRPLEASGTSGMKAALNGTLNLSVLDGWWPEAFLGDNGWAIGTGEEVEDHTYQDEMESRMLYDLLENEVVPLFYERSPDGVPREWASSMKSCLQTICPQFNTTRMVSEYAERFYLPAARNAARYSRSSWAEPRDVQSWRDRVRQKWHDVTIRSVEADTSHEVELGSELAIRARVSLGSLAPGDVLVEVRYGPVLPNGEVMQGTTRALKHVRRDGDIHVFQGTIPCREAGLHGFGVRIIPHRPGLPTKFEPGLITWWEANQPTPAPAEIPEP